VIDKCLSANLENKRIRDERGKELPFRNMASIKKVPGQTGYKTSKVLPNTQENDCNFWQHGVPYYL
jgi:hypothetical protein